MCIRVLFASAWIPPFVPCCVHCCLVCVCVVASYWKALSDFTVSDQLLWQKWQVQQWGLCCRLCDTKSIEVKMLWMINRQQKHIEALLYQTWHQLYVCGCVCTISRHMSLSGQTVLSAALRSMCYLLHVYTNTHTHTYYINYYHVSHSLPVLFTVYSQHCVTVFFPPRSPARPL